MVTVSPLSPPTLASTPARDARIFPTRTTLVVTRLLSTNQGHEGALQFPKKHLEGCRAIPPSLGNARRNTRLISGSLGHGLFCEWDHLRSAGTRKACKPKASDLRTHQIVSSGSRIQAGTSKGRDAEESTERAWEALRNFRFEADSKAGRLMVRPMRSEDVVPAAELLTESFAEMMGFFTIRPLLRMQVLVYLQQRLLLQPLGVTLVAILEPASPKAKQELIATVELSFSRHSRPVFASLNPPGEHSYLCNMAVLQQHRRQGIGRLLLQAAEDLVTAGGGTELYLHCRLVDVAPQALYRQAGFEIAACDSVLTSLLTLQRQRALMLKRMRSP